MNVHLHVCMCTLCMPWACKMPEEGIRSPWTAVMDRGELPCECSELNLGPLPKQQVLSATEASLRPSAFQSFWAYNQKNQTRSGALKTRKVAFHHYYCCCLCILLIDSLIYYIPTAVLLPPLSPLTSSLLIQSFSLQKRTGLQGLSTEHGILIKLQ